MDNELQIFENQAFGKVRMVIIENEPWFVAKDVCECLAISKYRDAVANLDNDERVSVKVDTLGGKQEVSAVNEYGLYNLVLGSRKPEAKAFKRWITHEVIPTIRKTGSYTVSKDTMSKDEIQMLRAQTMAENTKNRRAKLWMQIAEKTDIPEIKHVATVYAANTLAGKTVLNLPEVKERTYTATEIGKILGISAMKVGRLANKYNLKTEKNGKLFYDKSPHSSKEVETFRYYECALDAFKAALEEEGA